MSKMKDIMQALENNVDLPDEEYKALCEKADKVTASNGIDGKAPLTEARRHKRIQSNFYGMAINILSSIHAGLCEQEELLRVQNVLLGALCEKKGININELFK